MKSKTVNVEELLPMLNAASVAHHVLNFELTLDKNSFKIVGLVVDWIVFDAYESLDLIQAGDFMNRNRGSIPSDAHTVYLNYI